MAIPVSGKTYRFNNVGAPTRRLNLYSSGSAANEMNVCLYAEDNTNEQQWILSNGRLLIKTNQSYCLDRFVGSSAPNNADIYQVLAQYDADQKITFEDGGSYVKIKLAGSAMYLTAYNNANGTGTGKSTTSAGNVYWAASSTSSFQRWTFAEVSTGGGSSGTYAWPTESRTIVRYSSSTHDGADIAPKVNQTPGDKVYAFMEGYVSMTGTPSSNPNEGYTVRIHHTNPLKSSNGYANIRTQYMHLQSAPLVSAYQKVTAGQLIGYMGNTGNVDPAPTTAQPGAGTHLHFEVRGGSATEFPLGGASSNGFYTGTVLTTKTYLDLA